jgi:hypothetical protein
MRFSPEFITRSSARVPLLALPLIQPHAPACLHQHCLYRRVCGLQAVTEGEVLWTGESGASRSYRGLKIPPTPRFEVRSFCHGERHYDHTPS